MIEERTVSYGWAGTQYASSSLRKINDEVVGTNYVPNPSAAGSSSSFTNASTAAWSGGPRARGYRMTATTATATEFALTTAGQPSAAPGQTWWGHALIQADLSTQGARRVSLMCRFRDAVGGNILGTAVTEQDIIPAGKKYSWEGTAGASASRELSGTAVRRNASTNPSPESGATTGLATNPYASKGTISVSTDVAGRQAGRSKSWKYTAAGGGDAEGIIITIPAGQQVVSMWMFNPSTGGADHLTITALDSNGVQGQQVRSTAKDAWTLMSVYLPNANGGTVALYCDEVEMPVGTAFYFADIMIGDGSYFDGGTTSTGTGSDTNVYELSVSGTAPAGTKAAELVIVRTASYQASANDVLWAGELALLLPSTSNPAKYFDGDSPQESDFVYVERPGEVSSDEWVEVNDIPLNTFAWNITTWGGNRLSPPSVRGDNIVIPGSPGEMFMNKELGSQTYTWNMWVQGSKADGSRPDNNSAQAEFDKNWRMLRKLLFNVRSLVKVTKRWYDADIDAVRSATGHAQFNGGLQPSMTGRARAIFSVDMLFPDPFFYGITNQLPEANTTAKTWREDVEGDWRTTAITATITGPRVNPKLTITHADGTQTWVKYTGTVAEGSTLVIDVDAFTAKLTTGSTTSSVTGRISHGGAAPWLTLEPGMNTIDLSSDSGAGRVSVSYNTVWF